MTPWGIFDGEGITKEYEPSAGAVLGVPGRKLMGIALKRVLFSVAAGEGVFLLQSLSSTGMSTGDGRSVDGAKAALVTSDAHASLERLA